MSRRSHAINLEDMDPGAAACFAQYKGCWPRLCGRHAVGLPQDTTDERETYPPYPRQGDSPSRKGEAQQRTHLCPHRVRGSTRPNNTRALPDSFAHLLRHPCSSKGRGCVVVLASGFLPLRCVNRTKVDRGGVASIQEALTDILPCALQLCCCCERCSGECISCLWWPRERSTVSRKGCARRRKKKGRRDQNRLLFLFGLAAFRLSISPAHKNALGSFER